MKHIREIILWGNEFAEKTDAKRQAFKAGSQKRLEDVKTEFIADRKESERIQEKLVYYQNEVEQAKSRGLDFSEKEALVAQVEKEIAEKEKEIVDGQDGMKRLEAFVKDYDDEPLNRRARQFWIRDVIVPVLEGLEATQAWGSKTVTQNNIVQTSIYIK